MSIDCVPVNGFAESYVSGDPIAGATVFWLNNTSMKTKTDSKGKFSFDAKVGDHMTLVIVADGFHTTQAATLVIPEGGLTGKWSVGLQVPSDEIYWLFKEILPVSPLPQYCHIVVTVAAANKSIGQVPQGEPNATCSIFPAAVEPEPFYFGYVDGLTNPFARGLTETTLDGGVLFCNVAVRTDRPYLITAQKGGVNFTNTVAWCVQPDSFINAPPWTGPQVIG